MTKRVYKYQVEKLVDEVSKMATSIVQSHEMAKVWNPHRECYAWRVNCYDLYGNYAQRYIGDTLQEAMEYFLEEREENRRVEIAYKKSLAA